MCSIDYLLVPREPRDGPAPARVSDLDDLVRFVVRWLTFIGFAVALTNSAAIAFLPLFAQESLEMTPTLAGVVAAIPTHVGALLAATMVAVTAITAWFRITATRR